MEIRHDVANYHKLTEEGKNEFWMKESNKPYSNISHEKRVKMEHTSRLVEAYIAASDIDKNILWSCYDQLSQIYCDKEKFIEEYDRKMGYKQ